MSTNTLTQLVEGWKNCTRCDLCKTRKAIVMWEGPAYCELMVVGQSPGVEEEINGRPFCGPAGQRLNAVLNLVGIPRSKIHITNALWCRSTDGYKNVTPTPFQLELCRSRLDAEIEVVDPTHIVCLGKEAIQSVYNGCWNKTTVVGRERRFGWQSIYVGNKLRQVHASWHPSYELRRSQVKDYSVNRQMAIDWAMIAGAIPDLVEKNK